MFVYVREISFPFIFLDIIKLHVTSVCIYITYFPSMFRYESTYHVKEMGIQSEGQAQRHRKLVSKIAGLSLNHPDPVMPMLLTSLITYSPDFVDLDHPESAERIQLHFANLLLR